MRLIDADKIGLTDFEIVMCNGDYKEAFTMLLDKITNQPTAYDIDKVVEELEKATQYIKIDGKPTSVKAIHPAQVIEIVKQGGVGKDVE